MHEAVQVPPHATSIGLQGINRRCLYWRIRQHEPKAVGLRRNGRCFDWLGNLHATVIPVVVTTLSVGLWSGSETIFVIQWITYAVAVNTDGVITTGAVALHFRSHR